MPREKGIPNKNGLHKYTKEEVEFLRENYPKFSLLELTKMFNEKFNCNIYYRTLSSAMKRKGIKSGRTGCFEKGCISFNKGKKQTEYMTPEGIEQSSKTRFQKGKNINKQRHKYAEVGTEVVDKNGYIMVRVAERIENKSHQFWKFKQQLIYEQHYGEIPKGHKVIFADGNNRNFDIDNLILVSNAELLKMNQYGLYYKGHAELTKAGLLITKLSLKRKEIENG